MKCTKQVTLMEFASVYKIEIKNKKILTQIIVGEMFFKIDFKREIKY